MTAMISSRPRVIAIAHEEPLADLRHRPRVPDAERRQVEPPPAHDRLRRPVDTDQPFAAHRDVEIRPTRREVHSGDPFDPDAERWAHGARRVAEGPHILALSHVELAVRRAPGGTRVVGALGQRLVRRDPEPPRPTLQSEGGRPDRGLAAWTGEDIQGVVPPVVGDRLEVVRAFLPRTASPAELPGAIERPPCDRSLQGSGPRVDRVDPLFDVV